MVIKQYAEEYKQSWDSFVRRSKNGTFLFCRDFMEYHSDRFTDCSLLFYKSNELKAILPANIANDVFHTHQGLTYGGLLMDERTKMSEVLEIFEILFDYLSSKGIKKIIYKAIPHIYHQLPSEEDLYALFRRNAKLIGRNIASSILFGNKKMYSDTRVRGLKKAEFHNLQIRNANDLSSFWHLLNANLNDRYGVNPTHSLSQLSYLKSKFDSEIQLYEVCDSEQNILSGCLLFITTNVVHVQYVASSHEGRECGAVDLLVDYVLNQSYSGQQYFDYGVSTEDNGFYLNEKLIYQKEGFGLRGIVYDIYSIEL